MNEGKLLVQLTIGEDGEVQVRTAPVPSGPTQELVFTPLDEGQEPISCPVSKELENWLKKAKPVSLDHLEDLMASSSSPPDPSTITIANQLPR